MLYSVFLPLPFLPFFHPTAFTINPLLLLSTFPMCPPSLSFSLSSPCPSFPPYFLSFFLSFSLLKTDLVSLHWWPWWFTWMVHSLPGASPMVPLQPPHAAALSSNSSLSCSFSPATMTAWHLLLSHMTSWYYHIGHRDICTLKYFLFNKYSPTCKCCGWKKKIEQTPGDDGRNKEGVGIRCVKECVQLDKVYI